jgi:hypothetical protein
MHRHRSLAVRIALSSKVAILSLVVVSLSGCSLGDVRDNAVAGVLGFVEDYAADLLAALVPPPGDVVGGGD